MKNTFRNIIFVTISVLLIGIISACSNSFSNEVSNPDSENLNNQNLGSATVRMFVPDYAAMAEKSESRAIAPQTAYVQLSGYNSVSGNWNVFQRIEFSSAVKTPVENSPENFPGNIFTITFDKVVAKSYQAGELKIELLNSAESVLTSGTNATTVNVQYGENASTTFYTVPENSGNSDSNLSKGEMKFMHYIMNANTHYTLHLDVEGSSYPDVVIFNENGTFEKYISVDSAESSRIEFTENSQTVKYIGVWADDGVAVSNYKLNLYTDLTDFTFKDSSIGFWGGEEYQVNLTPIPSDSYLGKATYTSSNPDITVNEDGLISGNNEAEGTITVSYNGISHSIAVNVYETATEITGVLSGEKLHWTKENSPYKVTGDILIEENAQLVIDPGVKVYFVGNNYIKMNGSIYAVGTKEDPITITKAASYNGSWNGLRIGGGSLNTTDTYTYNSGNILKYVNFSHAQTPLELNSPVFVDHCNFTDCYGSVSVSGDSVLINNNFENGISISSSGNIIITNNRIKSSLYFDWGGGVTASNNTFENCYCYFSGYNTKSFINNIFIGGTLYLGSDYYDCLRIQNNNFENFTGIMLDISGSHDSYKTIDFTGNYWGESQTAELIANEATGEKNVSFIRDYRDDFNLTEVDYTGWKREPVEGAGYQGENFIAFDYTVNGYNWNNGGYYPESKSPDLSIVITPQYSSNAISQYRVSQGYENLKNAEWKPYSKNVSFTVDLSVLENELAPIYIQLKDSEGNISSPVNHNIPYDKPVITSSIKDGASWKNPSKVDLEIDITDSSRVTRYEILCDSVCVRSDETSYGDSHWGVTHSLGLPYMASGEHLLTLNAWDMAGNKTTEEIYFTIEKDNSDVSSLAGTSWDTTTGQPLKDSKTVYLWHLDEDGNEVSGEVSLESYTATTGGLGNGNASCVGSYNTIPVDFSETNAYTVEFWQKGTGKELIISKSDQFSCHTLLSGSNCSGNIYNYYKTSSGSQTGNGFDSPYIDASTWHYWAFTYNGKYAAIYCDGVLVSFNEMNIELFSNENKLYIYSNNSGNYDEIRISNAARSGDEIAAYYKAAKDKIQ
ncbi:MAG: LamG-like jellyroll fold domain-containing protein [Treponema sp.]